MNATIDDEFIVGLDVSIYDDADGNSLEGLYWPATLTKMETRRAEVATYQLTIWYSSQDEHNNYIVDLYDSTGAKVVNNAKVDESTFTAIASKYSNYSVIFGVGDSTISADGEMPSEISLRTKTDFGYSDLEAGLQLYYAEPNYRMSIVNDLTVGEFESFVVNGYLLMLTMKSNNKLKAEFLQGAQANTLAKISGTIDDEIMIIDNVTSEDYTESKQNILNDMISDLKDMYRFPDVDQIVLSSFISSPTLGWTEV